MKGTDRSAHGCRESRTPCTPGKPAKEVEQTGRLNKPPAPIGVCVPQMGMHPVLTTEIERKDAFHGSMVIGYYKGKPIFIEPMISKAMLMEKKSFDFPIPDVPGLAGAHPTKFHAEYDAPQQAYRFTFSGFTPAT